MSNLGVDNIKGSDGNNGPLISGNVVFSGTSHIVLPKGTTAQRPTGVATGSLRFNTDTKLVEQYNGIEWVTLNSYGVGRGVFGGGYFYSGPTFEILNTLDYITISTTGNASDFGDLSNVTGYVNSSCSSSTRGIFYVGGNVPGTYLNTLDYITISTTGNGTKFGDLTEKKDTMSMCSSSIRGIIGGGYNSTLSTIFNTIVYITIATTGNATDFGDLSQPKQYPASCSSSTRGIFGGGGSPAPVGVVNTIDYITIATTGNATDFGDLTQQKQQFASCSSSTRGVFAGGTGSFVDTDIIEYITIATTGNGTLFGTLTSDTQGSSACSSSTRGVFGGGRGELTGESQSKIDYITIASQGTNSSSFGDLTVARWNPGGCSDSHGGLS